MSKESERRHERIHALAREVAQAVKKHRLPAKETGFALVPILGVIIGEATRDSGYGEQATVELGEVFKRLLLSHDRTSPESN